MKNIIAKIPSSLIYYEDESTVIVNGDSLEIVKYLPNDSIDAIITSPPYNVDLGNNKYSKTPYDLYKDNKEHKEYLEWLSVLFSVLYEKLCKGGRSCINIGDGKNGAIPTHSDIIQLMSVLGYIPMSHIVWDKCQVRNRTSWGSFLSPSSPSFPTPFEHILVSCKEDRKLQNKGTTDLTKEEFIEWSLSLWRFAPETKQKKIGHSAMFPEELPKRCIKMFTWKESIIVDPFLGAGTTLLAAKRLGRKAIGFEISKNYCEIAANRLKNL